ncbi:VacJ family lipoprotein [Novosphingobium sp. BL-8H]|uniref:MlaA family lipoprotein n=1 Tax=Novosphingobium sp. BL-8H TaxID=3127640 RepID=UPI0037569D1B
MITPLIVPAVLFAPPADLPFPNETAVQVGRLAGDASTLDGPSVPVQVDLPPPVVFIDVRDEAGQDQASADAADVPAPAPVPADDIEADAIKAERDPLEGFNRTMFGIYQAMDKAVYRPVAMGYQHVVPKPVRSGIRNFLSNLTEPFVFVNFLLQAKPGKAAETLARFTINSTLGLGGVIDVAKRKDFNLPHRPNGFGTTLAIYGVKSGPYLFIPFIGPTTLRDAVSMPADEALLPLAVGRPFTAWQYQFSTGAVNGLDLRAEADVELRTLFADAIDPYATLRSVYLQNRAAEIEETRGRQRVRKDNTPPELDAPLDDPAGASTPQQPSDAPELRDPMKDPAGN